MNIKLNICFLYVKQRKQKFLDSSGPIFENSEEEELKGDQANEENAGVRFKK